MHAEPATTVRRRCVFIFGGYEHVPADQHYRRFVREIDRYRRTWNVEARVSPLGLNGGAAMADWHVESRGPNWRVHSDIHLCDWDDLIAVDFERSDAVAVPKGVFACLDFLVFALVRYLRANWRYALFFLYPLLLFTAFEVAGILVGWQAVLLGLPMPWITAPLLAVAVIWLLVRWPGRPLRLRYMLHDWTFARDLVRHPRPEYEARIEEFARGLVARAKTSDADEIIVAGHSIGAVLVMETLAAALGRDPALLGKGTRIRVVTMGSSLLKIGLHPAAHRLRMAVKRVADQPGLFWADYQSLVDIISFYKCDPVAEMGLATRNRPVLRQVSMRRMLSQDSYRRFSMNYLRLHRQFVMGNELRCHYDWFMICCGPVRLEDRALSPDAAVAMFAADGSLRPSGEHGARPQPALKVVGATS
jgi:hypothetical protein